MKIIDRTINAQGLKEIHVFLSENHKLGGDHFDEKMLEAWAEKAEFQLAEGNPACIEIASHNSVSGHAVEYRISDDGIDSREIDIDDE